MLDTMKDEEVRERMERLAGYGLQAVFALACGSLDRYDKIGRAAVADNAPDLTLEDAMELPVAEILGHDTRALNGVEEMGITTVGELLKTKPSQLSAQSNVADATLASIIHAAKQFVERCRRL